MKELKYYPVYMQYLFLLPSLILLLFLISYLFFGSVVYCDEGSINSLTNMVENINLDDQAQNIEENGVNTHCSTAFIPYQVMLRRKLY